MEQPEPVLDVKSVGVNDVKAVDNAGKDAGGDGTSSDGSEASDEEEQPPPKRQRVTDDVVQLEPLTVVSADVPWYDIEPTEEHYALGKTKLDQKACHDLGMSKEAYESMVRIESRRRQGCMTRMETMSFM